MQNIIMNMLMNQLQSRNPQAFQMINQARQSNANPQDLLKQFMNGASPEQIQQIMQQAQQYGAPKEILSQIQNNK